MKVLFIVTSYWAYGELLIALQFALDIQKSGYEPHFLIPPSHEKILKSYNLPYTLLIPKAGNINRIFMKDIEQKHRPQYIILSDFLNYHFCEKHYGLTVEDLSIFSGKIGTFDNFDWKLKRTMMDTYGFPANTVRNVDIDRFGFKVTPCPIANPFSERKEDQFFYPLVEDYIPYDEDTKQRHRKDLDLPADKPVVLVTSAAWQQKYIGYENVTQFVDLSNEMYFKILSAIAKDGIILYIGSEEEGKFQEANVRFLKSLPPAEFDKYAAASDLFISRNITSTTLARLALSGIPCVMIKNSVHFASKTEKDFKSSFEIAPWIKQKIDSLELCYPYYMFPVGWHTFLKPVLEGNPYADIITTVEQFDFKTAIDTIDALLRDSSKKSKIAGEVAAYKQHLEKLPRPSQIMALL